MSELTRALSTALVDFLWQGAIVGLLLWIALVMLRNRSANARYAVSSAALLALAVLPLMTIIALSASAARPDVAAASGVPLSTAASRMPQTMLPIWMVSETPRIEWLALVQLWALPTWSIGVLLFSVRLAGACRHAMTIRRGATPSDEPVLSTVARLAHRIGITRPVLVLTSSLTDGPSVVGWLRPAILLPPATAMGLTPQQLEAVLAHELAHIKRHDYLVNLLQVIAETLFFYHPVVWWTSRQVRAERELCCDDIAVQSCGDAVGYARALTTLARRQLEAPVLAMPATGGPLMHRVQRLIGAASHEYGPSRAPGVLALCLVLACLVVNLDWLQAFAEPQASSDVRFEVASVKPNNRNDGLISDQSRNGRWTATGYTLAGLIRAAYQVQEFQIVGGPGWIDSDRFDVVAKAPDDAPPVVPGATPSRHQLMLRALLAERFNLAVHKETREMPIFALVIARGDGRVGPNLRKSSRDCSTPAAARGGGANASAAKGPWESNPCGTSVGPGVILAGARTMAQIATAFSRLTNTGSSLNRLVVDRTGLEGTYDAELRFTPEFIPNFDSPGFPAVDRNGPSIFSAVQEQLGLKLDPQRGPVEVLVIDRVERPTPD
jgi:uncharacterized protein (TIGR03435 family)